MSKRAAYTYGVDQSGKNYWRSLDELAQTDSFKEALEREFPEGASELTDPVSRRSFIGLMGASLGLAGLAGCRRPDEKILPYNKRPEDLIPGESRFYATAFPFMGTAIGLLVESHDGRPTKIEGNPQHPESLGATNTFAQASVLDLYDVSRTRTPMQGGQQKSWTDAAAALKARGALAADKNGRGLVILTEAHRSPTLDAQLTALTQQWPDARVFRYDPLSQQNAREGARLAFGRTLEPVLDTAKAKVLVTLDADILTYEGSPVRQARGFIDGRRLEQPTDTMNRLYAVESTFTITGSKADHRLRLNQADIAAFTVALARELGVELGGASLPAPQAAKAQKWIKAVAKDLQANRGQGLVVAGQRQPAFVHALAALINTTLGNVGTTVTYVRPFSEQSDGPEQLAALTKLLNDGQVETLLVLGGNPAFSAPGDIDFAAAMKKAAVSFHSSLWLNETGEAATWHLNGTHVLETWGDVRAQNGLASVIQPLIAPLFGGKTSTEIVELLQGGTRKGYELVRTHWQPQMGAGFELGWTRALHDGVLQGTEYPAEQVAAQPAGLTEALAQFKPQAGAYEVTFHPDSHALDGTFANNGWMQEMPDQMSKLTWGNAAHVSPSTARELGVKDGDLVEIAVGGRSVKLPALVFPGQADKSIAVTVGQGRRAIGQVAKGVGHDTYPLRTQTAFYVAFGASAKKAGGNELLGRTQEHHTMEGRPLAREGTLTQLHTRPSFAKEMVKHPPLKNLWNEADSHKYEGHKWGMTIDLNACIGCNACMIACQSENNVPLVGKDGVVRGREMHWLRIDRYYEGTNADEPTAVMQPMACVHCENAPCELVCPVAATTHSTEGINEMTYNRCVGTRYCANNCPYKVRRFNFFNYNVDVPELRKMQMNPNVTVRTRGVMEKCSYCVQRVQEGKIAAKREQRTRVRDGEVVSACAQTCPTNAIVFGDLNDPQSQVARLNADPRAYHVLADINVRPRTAYLANIRNPNPELEAA